MRGAGSCDPPFVSRAQSRVFPSRPTIGENSHIVPGCSRNRCASTLGRHACLSPGTFAHRPDETGFRKTRARSAERSHHRVRTHPRPRGARASVAHSTHILILQGKRVHRTEADRSRGLHERSADVPHWCYQVLEPHLYSPRVVGCTVLARVAPATALNPIYRPRRPENDVRPRSRTARRPG